MPLDHETLTYRRRTAEEVAQEVLVSGPYMLVDRVDLTLLASEYLRFMEAS